MSILGSFVFICTCIFVCLESANCASCNHSEPADIIFLIDGSGSVTEYGFGRALEFVRKIVDGFEIGPRSTQVSVAVFTDIPVVEFHFQLNTYSSKSALQSHIARISYPSGVENISQALEQARLKFLDPSFGSRPSAAGIVVLMTDGGGGGNATIRQSIASSQRLKDMNITVYTAGVGYYVTEYELRDMKGCICYNGGTCVPGNIGYTCDCTPAYGGFYCDKTICEVSSPCHQGRCSIDGDMWLCTCYPGYTDNNCSTNIDECSSNPCVNGTCIDQINGFTCDCTPGFNGTLCEEEINECAPNPCQNNGTCTDLINAFACDCVPGYTGIKCETDIDECLSSPCEKGGTCNDRVNAFTCDCPSGYYGDYCETGICQPSVADIVFVLDSSVSQTKEQFLKQLEFINQFIDHIVIGDKNLQVGVVTYAFEAKIEIHIGQYNDNATLKEAVSNIKYRPGATFTDKGLQAAIDVFNQAPGKRPYDKIAKRYVYVMTDGMSNNRKNTAQKANELKAVVNKVLAIGIGSQVSHEELLNIASEDSTRDQKYVYSVHNFDALYTILKELVKLTCDECTWKTNADIVFILDDTSNELQTALHGITYLTQKTMLMEDDNSTVRIGLVTYGSDIKLKRSLNDTIPKDIFLFEIQNIVRQDAQCSADKTDCDANELDKAIKFVRRNVFESNTSAVESDTRELIIVLSNGRDEINDKLNSELNDLKSENRKIFAISLGDEADVNTLQKIVGDPALVFALYDEAPLSVLDALTTDFFFSVCNLSNEF
ncbi:collagen [Mactra antiquata]